MHDKLKAVFYAQIQQKSSRMFLTLFFSLDCCNIQAFSLAKFGNSCCLDETLLCLLDIYESSNVLKISQHAFLLCRLFVYILLRRPLVTKNHLTQINSSKEQNSQTSQ